MVWRSGIFRAVQKYWPALLTVILAILLARMGEILASNLVVLAASCIWSFIFVTKSQSFSPDHHNRLTRWIVFQILMPITVPVVLIWVINQTDRVNLNWYAFFSTSEVFLYSTFLSIAIWDTTLDYWDGGGKLSTVLQGIMGLNILFFLISVYYTGSYLLKANVNQLAASSIMERLLQFIALLVVLIPLNIATKTMCLPPPKTKRK